MSSLAMPAPFCSHWRSITCSRDPLARCWRARIRPGSERRSRRLSGQFVPARAIAPQARCSSPDLTPPATETARKSSPTRAGMIVFNHRSNILGQFSGNQKNRIEAKRANRSRRTARAAVTRQTAPSREPRAPLQDRRAAHRPRSAENNGDRPRGGARQSRPAAAKARSTKCVHAVRLTGRDNVVVRLLLLQRCSISHMAST